MQEVVHFSNRRKLTQGLLDHEILERIGKISYHLVLHPTLEGERNIFHILELKQYVRDETHIMNYSVLEIKLDLSYSKQS